MSLQIYNSMTQKKEAFAPLAPPTVKMYVCGPTVYGLLHVGNFRGPIVMNFVRNWLEALGYQVTYHANFTDVDDKIIDRANKDKVPAQELAEKYIGEYRADYKRLGLRPHDLNPKVTESMDEIVEMIGELIKKDKAYVAGADVNYSIRSFKEYGKLSHRNPDDMLTAVRIERDEKKKDPLDFALWKAAKPGEPSWPSPWGPGRPGWHIECSAMIHKNLGETIDIHGGGMDLIFPHHENEIAQSEGCTGKVFVKTWMHWNMINFSGAKMSKSVGNIVTGREFMEQYTPEVLKYMTLAVHYRSTLDLSDDSVDLAVSGLARIYSALACADSVLASAKAANVAAAENSDVKKAADEAWTKAKESFNDDFNTAEAMARLFEVVRVFNSKVKRGQKATPPLAANARDFKEFIGKFAQLMAIFQESPEAYLRSLDDRLLKRQGLERAAVDAKVAERKKARDAKDFKRSDELRDELVKLGISVADTPEGSFWEVAK